MTDETEQPYLVTQRIVTDRHYNPAYGDDRICECGHAYYRHFDSQPDLLSCQTWAEMGKRTIMRTV